jgi:hypothetical protein
MSNRAHKRHKHQARVLSAMRYLRGAKGMRISPTQAVIRAMHLRAYYAEHEALGSDVPF